MHYQRVLTIAGSDSGGGAGIQADIKAISACGCYAASAITAVTVQNTTGVREVYPIPAPIIAAQITAVLGDIGADAIKIGMLHSSEVIRAVRASIEPFGFRNVVLDPVMVSTSGHQLMRDDAIVTLRKELLGVVRIITPNIPEAEVLLGRKINGPGELAAVARALSEERKVSVLLKAGHLEGDELTDVFYNAEEDEIIALSDKRVDTVNTHGTGCTLSSAVAAFLARGFDLTAAVRQAKAYIDGAIWAGADYSIGEGHGPVHHFYQWWKK